MIRLYGAGAVVFSHGKDTFTARNGVIDLPPDLVERARALGFSTVAPIAVELEEVLDEGLRRPAIDASRTDADLLAEFENDALGAGYTPEASALIASERLAHLRTGGDGYGLAERRADPDATEGETAALALAKAEESGNLPETDRRADGITADEKPAAEVEKSAADVKEPAADAKPAKGKGK